MKDIEAHDACTRLHKMLEAFPWSDSQKLQGLPSNGLYFFYEDGENCGSHGPDGTRIVRVGTHRKQGNLVKRLQNHYRTGGGTRFRRQLCRAIASKAGRWESWMGIAGTVSADPHFPADIQEKVTAYFSNHLRFRCIEVNEKEHRIDLEERSIGTLANCAECSPSAAWLGRYALEKTICKSGLWAVQHVKGQLRLREQDLEFITLLAERSPD